MSDEPNYYAIIPANVRYDRELKDKAKLLYGEIAALSNKNGYCYASNSYFAELYGVSTTTISLLIKDLVDKDYITSELIYKNGTKEIQYRYLKIVKEGIKENLNTYLRNFKDPIKENLKDNNINIILNNNIYFSLLNKIKEKVKNYDGPNFGKKVLMQKFIKEQEEFYELNEEEQQKILEECWNGRI